MSTPGNMPPIPPGRPRIPPTLRSLAAGNRRRTAEATRRGSITAANVAYAWSAYTVPGGGVLKANAWQKLNVFSLAAGNPVGMTFAGGNLWTPAAGLWTVKAFIICVGGGNNLSTALLFALADGQGTAPGNIYGIGSGTCVGQVVPATFSVDVPCSGSTALQLWCLPSWAATVNNIVVSYRQIG